MFGSELVGLENVGDKVCVTVNADGEMRQVNGDLVVGADGINSKVVANN